MELFAYSTYLLPMFWGPEFVVGFEVTVLCDKSPQLYQMGTRVQCWTLVSLV